MNNSIRYYLGLAACVARKGVERTFRLGAVGVRKDGAVVTASNGCPNRPNKTTHAESRLVRKLDVGAEVYVVRIGRQGRFLLSKPCANCRRVLKARGVARVTYTTENGYERLVL